MRKNLLPLSLLSVFLFVSICSYSQSLRYQVALPYISLGAYTTKQQDPFSFINNQAALAQTKAAGAGVYGERRFMLAENSAYGVAVAVPTSLGNIGLSVNYAGFANFNENKIGLAYARSLGSKLDLGVQFNYYGYRVPAYGNASAINFEIGAIMHISDKLNAGIHAYNPAGGKLGKSGDEKLAAAYKFGLGYDASDNFFVSTELIKEEGKAVNAIGGIRYQFMKQFFARVGFMSETGSGYGGVGVSWKNLRLDVTGSYHPQLGFSPGLMLIVNFKNSAE
ncbi:MAG: hypothetical protein ABIY51_06480 [Ferruginibacter sp.]